MSIHYLNIEGKHRPMDGFVAGLSNFRLTDGETVNAEVILNSSTISLYCLDDQTKQAIFVELPPEVDLSKASFVNQTQYLQAQRFIAVPYEDFKRLAGGLPSVDHLIFVHTTGRAGSTLLSNAFNELDSVLSLSEHDIPTQFVYLHTLANQQEAELRELFNCSMRFLFKPVAFKQPTTYALKLQEEVLEIMDLLQATFPRAKNLFLYRDAVSWVASYYRVFKRAPTRSDEIPLDGRLAILKAFLESTPKGADSDSPNGDPDFYALEDIGQFVGSLQASTPRIQQDFGRLMAYLEPGFTGISMTQMLTLWWIFGMEWYLTQAARQIPVLPVRYKDMNAHPEKVLTEIFQYCDLPTSQVAHALRAFAKDSQEGTALARDNAKQGNQFRLSERQIHEITAILHRHPVLNESDLLLPGSVRV